MASLPHVVSNSTDTSQYPKESARERFYSSGFIVQMGAVCRKNRIAYPAGVFGTALGD